MEIRHIIKEDDYMKISHVYEESWKSAYKGMIPDAYLASIPEGKWISNLDSPQRNHLIMLEDQKIIGTACYCASRFHEYKDWGEIVSIYFLPEYMGRGYGIQLLNRAITELRQTGYRNIFLWVLEENLRARHFYEKAGFHLGNHEIKDNIYGKDIKEISYCLQFDENTV